jgi:hypothetical protein
MLVLKWNGAVSKLISLAGLNVRQYTSAKYNDGPAAAWIEKGFIVSCLPQMHHATRKNGNSHCVLAAGMGHTPQSPQFVASAKELS